ncbi:hypothetical protein PMAYCL1PPCAC_17041 [Pristionchus mayeri]|uniref:Uncharacterized protein n=1 Tax=Pristionchus mayeri TaxID=1317129 RepID=A0AAN5I0H3_9BILA|nr:hypothetical protein PMAYCL1PPCAC_17041 [Pristionchus mayeri]
MLPSRVALRAGKFRGMRAFSSSATPGEKKETKSEVQNEYSNPTHASKEQFEKDKIEYRKGGGGVDSQAPTPWQRRFLVWTRIYKKEDEIPRFVPLDTMMRMNDRLRGVVIACLTIGLYSIYRYSHRKTWEKIYRDREEGVVVPKMDELSVKAQAN